MSSHLREKVQCVSMVYQKASFSMILAKEEVRRVVVHNMLLTEFKIHDLIKVDKSSISLLMQRVNVKYASFIVHYSQSLFTYFCLQVVWFDEFWTPKFTVVKLIQLNNSSFNEVKSQKAQVSTNNIWSRFSSQSWYLSWNSQLFFLNNKVEIFFICLSTLNDFPYWSV